ncbi:MAG: helix-turn-helix domain-containing protein [Bacteroidales bacterium]|nr:MAG: helix-turn-helix domain-containing protein [Bacteroidales bacterium]
MSRRLNFNEGFHNSLNEIISANFDKESFGVSELAHAMGMSRSNLHRKVKAITKTSSSQYLSSYRLKKGMELLNNSSDTVSEIAYKTGFGSPSYFIKCFHDFYGYSPGEVGNPDHSHKEEALIQKSEYIRKKVLGITIFAFLIIAILSLVFISIKFIPKKNKYQKTIAVLPFIDDSPESGNSYIINGLMDEILNKLEHIKDFSVKSRTDSEKFRDSKKSIGEIARELNVKYILEGSGQKIDDEIKLRIQLIETRSGNHLWSKTFTEDSENIFELQEKVALAVAYKLEAKLTQVEKSQIQKLSTKNKAAYNLYLKGMENYRIASVFNNVSDFEQSELYYNKGKTFFLQAIKIDSTYSDAYLRLSFYFMDISYYKGNNEHKIMCLDSGYYYAKKAMEYNLTSNWPDWPKGLIAKYYDRKGMTKEADKIREKFNFPAKYEYMRYQELVSTYFKRNDFYNSIQSYFRYKKLLPSDEQAPSYTLNHINTAFQNAGFYVPSKKIIHEKLMLYSDTTSYLEDMAELERNSGNFQKLSEHALKMFEKNTKHADWVMTAKTYLEDYAEAYRYCLEDEKNQKKNNNNSPPGILNGFVHLKNGNMQEAKYYLLEDINKCQEEIDLNMQSAQRYESHFFLFIDYLALGEKEKAFTYLKEMKQMKFVPYWVIVDLNHWPGFNDVSNDPVFIDVKNTLTSRYQKEHKRIEKLLEENGEINKSHQLLTTSTL